MERRLHDRTNTNVLLRCRVPAQPCRAIMRDISYDGCRLEFVETAVQRGGSVSLEVPGCRPISGSIAWVHDLSAGLRFDNPLSSAAAISLGLRLNLKVLLSARRIESRAAAFITRCGGS
jgi:hypothetical protein